MDLKDKSLVILDRDGVINFDSDNYIRRVSDFILIPGSLDAIVKLKKAGKMVAITTNQSGIARGYYDLKTLHLMHEKLADALHEYGVSLDKLYYCPHGPQDNCDCRKPKPGMLMTALQDLNCKPEDAIAIGDSIRDLQAAHAANIDSILVKTGKGMNSVAKLEVEAEFFKGPIFENLAEAVKVLV